ncbi:MAG: AAA family ATPase [Verrucomicrobiota bacterium]
MSQCRFIAVTGGSGSGKSWLGAALMAEFGTAASHLSLDDFYHDLGHLPEAARGEVNFDDPAAIDWEALREVLECLERGDPVRLPQYDFASHTRRVATRRLERARFVVLDGLWLLHHAWLRDKLALSVFVDCPEAERLRRRVARDVLTRGRSEDSVLRQFTTHVQPMHQRFVEPQRQWATHCVNSPLPPQVQAELFAACLAT